MSKFATILQQLKTQNKIIRLSRGTDYCSSQHNRSLVLAAAMEDLFDDCDAADVKYLRFSITPKKFKEFYENLSKNDKYFVFYFLPELKNMIQRELMEIFDD